MLLCHMNRKGFRLHQRIPFPLDIIGSRYEYRFMGLLGKMTDADWLYRFSQTRKLVDWLAGRIVIPMIHGEVLTPDEVESLITNLESEGHVMALGLCECRHGEKMLDEELEDGRDPNRTCVMIGDWGRAHLYEYPRYYRPVEAGELIETARFWHRRGRVLSAWGCSDFHGFMVSYCHCLPRYCVPLRNQLKRGNRVFLPGYNLAEADPLQCPGRSGCEIDCLSRCHFGAIHASGNRVEVDAAKCYGCGQCWAYCPSKAIKPVPRKGWRLVYGTPDLLGHLKGDAQPRSACFPLPSPGGYSTRAKRHVLCGFSAPISSCPPDQAPW